MEKTPDRLSDVELASELILKRAQLARLEQEMACRGKERIVRSFGASPLAGSLRQAIGSVESKESLTVRAAMLEASISSRIRVPFSVGVCLDEDAGDDRHLVTFSRAAWSCSIDDYTWDDWSVNCDEGDVESLALLLASTDPKTLKGVLEAEAERFQILRSCYLNGVAVPEAVANLASFQDEFAVELAAMAQLSKDVIVLAQDFIGLDQILGRIGQRPSDGSIRVQPTVMHQIAGAVPTLMSP